MTIEFNLSVGEADWNAAVGAWHASALSIPGATVVGVFADGAKADDKNYRVDGDMLRWSGPRPTNAVVRIRLDAKLELEERRLALEQEKHRSEVRLQLIGFAGAALAFLLGTFGRPLLHLGAAETGPDGGAAAASSNCPGPVDVGIATDVALSGAVRAIDHQLVSTSRKGEGPGRLTADATRARVERAVFLSVPAFGADAELLKAALKRLSDVRGAEVADYQEAVNNRLRELLQLRRSWLQQVARPALQKAMDPLSPQSQGALVAKVDLPSRFDILVGKPGIEAFTDLDDIDAEIALIDKALTK